MNGRVYDPVLGRFLSADPFIQLPQSTQGLNRYTYAGNNPLSFTDPSDFFFGSIFRAIKKLFNKVGKIVGNHPVVKLATYVIRHVEPLRKLLQNQYVQIVGSIAAVYFGGPGGAAAFSAAVTIANGGSPGDALFAAAIALASAKAFKFVGGNEFFGPVTKGIESITAERVLAHGVIGGVRSAFQGGKFLRGFLSGAVAKIATHFSTIIGRGSAIGGAMASAAVGGTVSIVGGGKFANGALTRAYGYLFNYHLSRNSALVGNSFDRSKWDPLKRLEGTSSFTFNAGDRIAVETSSVAFPPTNMFRFDVSALGLNADGTAQVEMASPAWYQTDHSSGFTGSMLSPNQFVFEAGAHTSTLFRWTVSIPPQQQAHDNFSYNAVTIYTPYDPRRQ